MEETVEMVSVQELEALNEQASNQKKKHIKKKTATTIYLTEEAEHAFIELYIHRLRKDKRADKSMIACQVILELYDKECKLRKT